MRANCRKEMSIWQKCSKIMQIMQLTSHTNLSRNYEYIKAMITWFDHDVNNIRKMCHLFTGVGVIRSEHKSLDPIWSWCNLYLPQYGHPEVETEKQMENN